MNNQNAPINIRQVLVVYTKIIHRQGQMPNTQSYCYAKETIHIKSSIFDYKRQYFKVYKKCIYKYIYI